MKTSKHSLRVVPFDNPCNPRDWSNLGTIAYTHRRYILGEEKIDDPINWLCEKINLRSLPKGAEKMKSTKAILYFFSQHKRIFID